MTYLENDAYHVAVELFADRLNRESIFGGHEEPVVTADTLKTALGELFAPPPPIKGWSFADAIYWRKELHCVGS